MLKIYILALIFLFSCTQNHMDDLREEAKSICSSITEDLKKVHTKEDLLAIRPALRRKFNRIAKIMVEVENLQKEPVSYEISQDTKISDNLLFEMQRVYQIPGAQKIIEQSQISALDILENR